MAYQLTDSYAIKFVLNSFSDINLKWNTFYEWDRVNDCIYRNNQFIQQQKWKKFIQQITDDSITSGHRCGQRVMPI